MWPRLLPAADTRCLHVHFLRHARAAVKPDSGIQMRAGHMKVGNYKQLKVMTYSYGKVLIQIILKKAIVKTDPSQ